VLTGIVYALAFLVGLIAATKVRSATLRTIVLLLASYAAYLSWSHWFFVVLLASTIGNYGFGRWIGERESRFALFCGISFNLALLSTFKYLPPIAATLPFSSLQKFPAFALPLGISFWTFQAMSYLFDQYRGEELDPTFFEFALYMAFFPVAISGPICRTPDMLSQFRSNSFTSWKTIGRGLARIATGVLMMQLAKLLGQGILSGDGVNSGFDRVSQWGGLDVWFLALGYGLQLFFDFAGYSHIAIGTAQALGFTIPENFERPFSSNTPSIFWTRWHMSLSFWIRDYVFLPLATMRREMWWRNGMLVVSMVAFGLWHKASILFVLWGAYHGVLLLLHRQVQQLERKFDWEPPEHLWKPLSWCVTMGLVSLGWIFFRAGSLTQARGMLTTVISPASYLTHFLSSSFYMLVAALAFGYAVVLLMVDMLSDSTTENATPRSPFVGLLSRHRWYWIPALYALLLFFVWMVTSTQSGGVGQMVYRRF
jgi:alginate O-acetyltransferase complex protein AlgI